MSEESGRQTEAERRVRAALDVARSIVYDRVSSQTGRLYPLEYEAAIAAMLLREGLAEALEPVASAPAATEPAPGSEEDWREALRVVQEIVPHAELRNETVGGKTSRAIGWPCGPSAVWDYRDRGRDDFGYSDCEGEHHPTHIATATAAARAYVASRRADPTPEPLVVDGWTLDGDE